MDKVFQKARDLLLSDRYGKFDLIETIMPADLLLNAKPRRVREWIVETLELQAEQVNYNTFSSWLKRYRAGRTGNQQVHDWRRFKPTEMPTPLTSRSEPIVLKKVSGS